MVLMDLIVLAILISLAVVAVQAYDSFDEALHLADDTRYAKIYEKGPADDESDVNLSEIEMDFSDMGR